MARKAKAAEAAVDVNEAANRVDLRERADQAEVQLLEQNLAITAGHCLVAMTERDQARAEVKRLEAAAAVPVTKVVGIGALSRCLGYSGSMMLLLVNDGMPHDFEEGTAVFDLPKVHRWMLDRREARVSEDCRDDFGALIELLRSEKADLQSIVSNQVSKIERLTRVCPDPDAMLALADVMVEAVEFVTDAIDDTLSNAAVPGKPETILENEDDAARLVNLADFARRLRAAHADIPLGLAEPFSILEAR